MRQHFPYVLTGTTPVPGGGDAKSWLEYYKINPGAGETYIPHADPSLRGAKDGDILWFIFENEVLGYSRILRIVEDPINDRVEVWYNAENFVPFKGLSKVPPTAISVPLPSETGEEWLVAIMSWS